MKKYEATIIATGGMNSYDRPIYPSQSVSILKYGTTFNVDSFDDKWIKLENGKFILNLSYAVVLTESIKEEAVPNEKDINPKRDR